MLSRQSIEPSLVPANPNVDAAHMSFLSLASPALFSAEQWHRGCAPTALRLLAALFLRIALVLRTMASLLCPFKRAAARVSTVVGACFEWCLACIYLCAIVLGLWPHGPRGGPSSISPFSPTRPSQVPRAAPLSTPAALRALAARSFFACRVGLLS